MGILFFIVVQLITLSGLVLLWMRMKKNTNDELRWSRNFQILQSKIAVFEDLSDRTETQVQQLTLMMENKICDLQRKIDEADEILNKISHSMKKSMEVAQIFQDKIPHEEIIERQNTVKFVRAALMAHEGKSEDEIAQCVDLPKSQIEFIVKVNGTRLSFDPQQMPEWLRLELKKEHPYSSGGSFVNQGRSPLRPLHQLMKQKMDFVETSEANQSSASSTPAISSSISSTSEPSPIKEEANPPTVVKEDAGHKVIRNINIRPVVFPRIESPRSLR